MEIPAELDYFVDTGVLKEVLSNLQKDTKFIFSGPSGSGKTFLAKCLANKLNYAFVSIDLLLVPFQTADQLYGFIARTATSKNLQGQENLLLITSAEKLLDINLSLFQRIKELPGLIILETNSEFPFLSKYKRYIEGYVVIKFNKLPYAVLKRILNYLIRLNNVYIPIDVQENLINNAHGNAQSLINDFKSFLTTHSRIFAERNSEDSIFITIRNLLSGRGSNVFFSSEDEIKVFLMWLAEEVPLNLSGDKLRLAMEIISYSDLLLNMIKKQNWFLLKYINTLINQISTFSNVYNPKLTYKIKYTNYLSSNSKTNS
jgi:DNA polymerase III delta prime subunit